MPTYVYRCDSCKHQFEIFQKMSDDALDTCPRCEARVRRIIHPVGIVFKGSGWYITDSKSSGSSGDTAAASSDADGSGADKKPSDTDSKSKSKSSDKETAKTAAD
ncbi:MAG TPA: FmdB family zinc ribbon protein [Thermomicrobiales bacterium]|nr:FmdB family zinc ribbon protein [Thermomicrobiales bacterium]